MLDVSDNALRALGLRALLEGVRAQQALVGLDLASCRLGHPNHPSPNPNPTSNPNPNPNPDPDPNLTL